MLFLRCSGKTYALSSLHSWLHERHLLATVNIFSPLLNLTGYLYNNTLVLNDFKNLLIINKNGLMIVSILIKKVLSEVSSEMFYDSIMMEDIKQIPHTANK